MRSQKRRIIKAEGYHDKRQKVDIAVNKFWLRVVQLLKQVNF